MAADNVGATVTIRLIRSFEYRNVRNIVLRNVDLQVSVNEFKDLINTGKQKLY